MMTYVQGAESIFVHHPRDPRAERNKGKWLVSQTEVLRTQMYFEIGMFGEIFSIFRNLGKMLAKMLKRES